MADNIVLKSNNGYTGKLYLPTDADIAQLKTAQTDITTLQTKVETLDPTARFIVASSEPATADDGKIWIEVASMQSA